MPKKKQTHLETTSKAVQSAANAFEKYQSPVWQHSLLTDFDVSLFLLGKHFKLYEKMGAHLCTVNGVDGVYFAVWAPNAQKVYVMANFNGWNRESHLLFNRWDESGIWEGFIPHLKKGEVYKYFVKGFDGSEVEKSDPYALHAEHPPRKASIVWDTDYAWKDKAWMNKREKKNALDQPISVYEVHLGSWQRDPADPERVLSYGEVAAALVPYVLEMGFTHVEFLPVMEYPYYPSWGYQVTGYYAASSRHGSPQDLMFLIEELHKNNIAVILDWVPSHFPGDSNGLYHFDGTHLYEHSDMRKGFHPDWKSYIFNYDRNEVRSFLISNAMFWLDKYHLDGLRVDAVASMLYFDFSRQEGEYGTNEYGGTENLGAVKFLKDMNEAVYGNFKGIQTIAEESSTYDGVTRPVFAGGLGFGMKWMMGWMNDTLKYFKQDPLSRKHHHHQLTFSLTYAFTENFMLPLSHDEVVHGKSPMIYKMPGDEWQKFANLRALYAYMFTHPGTKLLFMGDEFAQTSEWNCFESLNWDLLKYAPHKGMQNVVKKLNELYRSEAALYHFNFSNEGFEWQEADDVNQSIYVYQRRSNKAKDTLVIAINLTPVFRQHYRIGIPVKGKWQEIFNSDAEEFYGSGKLNAEVKTTENIAHQHQKQSIMVDLPPMAVTIFKRTVK
ncbi:1,4-alpha-glucan branching protein GlgB [Pedobacter chitinilyticus]|uniref:1,4-alpha-glucan branching enzyme GlgB n=1 Tax=Pedobacter chitinilyticus TaxID=2233776 RepID=A0A443YWF9_9SPHI|nr:1,4-alpha-glucan branching protein GlgB [Pedobacter chitinilyticus]RWU08341.1 1,4-alpha-glucan branching protein GlgB [Pedobacter chitinilyticus]